MRNSALSQCEPGSAEEVIAHAAWRRSRGRKPSMSYLNQRNPRKALSLANVVLRGLAQRQATYKIGQELLSRMNYDEMSDNEIKFAVGSIVASSSSDEEIRQRVGDELGYSGSLLITTLLPRDNRGRRVRELVRGVGGLVMKNGTMALITMPGHENEIKI